MQMASPRPPIPPVTNATRNILIPLAEKCLYRAFLDVTAGSRFDRLVFCTSRFARCPLFSRQRFQPSGPVGPPAALLFLGAVQPAFGVLFHIVVDPVAALVLTRRVDHPRDMAGGTEHETALAAEQARALVGRLPRNDMVLARRQQVDRHVELAEVDLLAAHRQL